MTQYLGTDHREPITAEGLDTIEVPPGVSEVEFTSEELTALCPVTSQPDFYSIRVVYIPAGTSLESKALKLYLAHYRTEGIFAEDLCARIAKDLSRALKTRATVRLEQQVRGGLVLRVTSTSDQGE